MLEDAGFEVERLDKPNAPDEEIRAALKGKVGYLQGGIEKISEATIDAADELKAIVFTGTSWKSFIPAHEHVTKKGIAIGSAPYLNAQAVAEFGVAMSLVMCRDMVALARGGPKTFETTKSISELKIGILGLGHIGEIYLRMVNGLGAKNVLYANRTPKPELEKEYGIAQVDKDELFAQVDLVFVGLGIEPGDKYVSASNIMSMKEGSIIVTSSDPLLFDLDALYARLERNEIRAAFDENIEEKRFHELALSTWWTPNSSSAFNTGQTIDDVSTSCVETLINLIQTGEDKYRAN
jgi:phosphoglycerate dehydrogenase-like enzyme